MLFQRRFLLVWVLFALTVTAAEAAQSPAPDWAPPLKADLARMADELSRTLKPWPVPERIFRVEDYGAVADGKTLSTEALQRAIDACSAAGGGVVLCSKGDYVTGTVELKSDVMLEVAEKSRILGSTNLDDYPERLPPRPSAREGGGIARSLFYADNCDRIGMRGPGIIDGRGTRDHFEAPEGTLKGRPFLIRMIECRSVVMDRIELRDAASWVQRYASCDDLIFDGMRVESQSNFNNDGIDIDGCRRVIVRNCFVNSEDDGLCFKGASRRPMEKVLVENSKFYSTCNAIKFGTDSQGSFRDVVIRNVEAGGPSEDMRAMLRRPAHSGISWEAVDGGTVENILCSEITIVRARAPIFLRRGNRGHGWGSGIKPTPGPLRRLLFEKIRGDQIGSLGAIIVAGIPGYPVEDVVIKDFTARVAGGGVVQGPKPEREADYPNAPMFGPVPGYGLWARHAQRVSLINTRITAEVPDARPLICVDEDAGEVRVDGTLQEPNPPGGEKQ